MSINKDLLHEIKSLSVLMPTLADVRQDFYKRTAKLVEMDERIILKQQKIIDFLVSKHGGIDNVGLD